MSTDGSHPRERGDNNLITYRSVASARVFVMYSHARLYYI